MVLRLFVPPGEGQHYIVPKRPEPLGANATLQYAVVSSTAAAAGYASYVARYNRRVAPLAGVSRTAAFIRASGRLGPWALAVGAAANAYYHSRFTNVIVESVGNVPTKWKVYEKTDKYTVDDACLAGATTGFVTFLPTLFMRRPGVKWWTRMVGMANIGACAGVVGSHAYFQYTGEQQKALENLKKQRRRRMLEFHYIFWDKLLMQRLDPLVQTYVRLNGIFRAYHLPTEVLDNPDRFAPASPDAAKDAPTTELQSLYQDPQDLAQVLSILDVAHADNERLHCEQQERALLKEAEYIAYLLSQKQYDYMHSAPLSEEDRRLRLRELQILAAAYKSFRDQATAAHHSALTYDIWIRQKKALAAGAERKAWLADTPSIKDVGKHESNVVAAHVARMGEKFRVDAGTLEEAIKRPAAKKHDRQKERWRADLEDARVFARAADGIAWELEKWESWKEDVVNKVGRSGDEHLAKVEGGVEKGVDTKTGEQASVDESAKAQGKAKVGERPKVDEREKAKERSKADKGMSPEES